MLNKLLLTAALVSTTYGADIDFSKVMNPISDPVAATEIVDSGLAFTINIAAKTVVSPNNQATTHIILCGDLDFNPKLSKGATTLVETNFKTVRTWFEGNPHNICFQFMQSFGSSEVRLTTSSMDEGATNIRFGDSTEAVLIFAENGTLKCVNPGKPNQFKNHLTLTMGNRGFKRGERYKSQNNKELNSYSSYNVTLDLRGLTLNLPKDSHEMQSH